MINYVENKVHYFSFNYQHNDFNFTAFCTTNYLTDTDIKFKIYKILMGKEELNGVSYYEEYDYIREREKKSIFNSVFIDNILKKAKENLPFVDSQ